MNQAGRGWVVYNNTFSEAIIKEVKTTSKDLARLITSPHKNIVELQEAIYHKGAIFLVYEIMDISLSQIFSSPLGRLQLFEVAAFSREILTGLEHIHKHLKIAHGDISSSSILLLVTGAVKVGMLS